MPALIKKKCNRCKKNYVTCSRRQGYVLCYDCQKPQLDQPIEDEKMAKLFDIPEELYSQNSFLCELKSKYIRFGSLSEKQIEVFQRIVKELTEGIDKPKAEDIELSDTEY